MNDRLIIKGDSAKTMAMPGFAGGFDCRRDESVLPYSRASFISGFSFEDGALKDGYGIESSAIKDYMVRGIWLYRRGGEEILMYATGEGYVMYFRGGENRLLTGVRFTGKPFGVNYRLGDEDVILICSSEDKMAVWNGSDPAYTVDGSPYIGSMAVHYERMFVTSPRCRDTLLFSDDLDPTNWNVSLSEGGRIVLADERGGLNKVISLGNYLYVFRDFGISRVTAYGDQTQFTVANLFVSSGRIFAPTVVLCGDTVVFLASDGLYAFDGNETRKILKEVSPLIEPDEEACAAYSEGKYYLSARSKEGKRVILVYEKGGGYDITQNIAVAAVYAAGKVYCLSDGMVGEITKRGHYFGLGFSKLWRSPYGDMGTDKLKLIKEISLVTHGPLTVKITADGRSRSFVLRSGALPQRIKVNMMGRLVGFEIKATGTNTYVTKPYIHYYVY